jgi:hypothetical protein
MAAIFNCKQGPHQDKELLSVLESYGGQMQDTFAAATPEMSALFTKLHLDDAQIETRMRNQAAASTFLLNADDKRFGTLRADLANNFSRGQDQYPTTLLTAYQLLLSYKRSQRDDPYRDRQRGGPPYSRFGRGRAQDGADGRGRGTDGHDGAVGLGGGTDGHDGREARGRGRGRDGGTPDPYRTPWSRGTPHDGLIRPPFSQVAPIF